MELLKKRILTDGKVFSGEILKVGCFLNHQIDISLLREMAKEVCRRFDGKKITKVLTVEASGIAYGTAIALELGVPLVFAKKSKSANISSDVLSAKCHSFTHGNDYDMVVEKPFVNSDDKLLIVDDFLASGQALFCLLDIAKQAGASVVGFSTEIEKGFQGGGDKLRELGYQVESLAVIDAFEGESLRFRN